MSWKGAFAAGDTIDFKFSTRRFNTGAPFTLAGTPAVSVYKGNSVTQSTAGVTLTVDFDSVTGLNHVRIDTTADGTFYANGSQFDVVITTGTVDSVSVVGETIGRFELRAALATASAVADVQTDTNDIQTRLPAALVGGRIDASVGAMANNVMTAAAAAADLTTELQAGLSTLDAAGVRAAVGLASANLDTQLSTIDDFLDTEVAAIKAKTDNLPSAAAGASGGLLINGTNAGAITLGDGLTISNSAGTALTLSSSGGNGHGLSAAGNGSGSGVRGVGGATGNGFSGVGGASSGDGFNGTAMAGNGNGFQGIGNGSGDGIMATGGVTGRGIHGLGGSTSGAGMRMKGSGGNANGIECIADGTGTDFAADNIATAAALGTPVGASISADIAAIGAYVDTEVAAIKVVTDKLDDTLEDAGSDGYIFSALALSLAPTGGGGDPWATSLPGAYGAGTAGKIVGDALDAAISTRATPAQVATALDTYDGPTNAELATALAAADDAVLAAIDAVPTATENADALLNRDMSAVSDTNARSPLNALRFLRNKWVLTSTTLSVKKENDTTEAWTAEVTASPGADPISGSDPA